MKIKHCFTICLLYFSFHLAAQEPLFDLDLEAKAYPTGLIFNFRVEGVKGRNAFHFGGGYNHIRHGDAGKHDDERGNGLGLAIGYKRYFNDFQNGFFIGQKNELWFSEIKWKNDIGLPSETSGKTEIMVFQPTAEAGWLFELGRRFIFAPIVAFGYEWNVRTKGSPTGEGPILLVGVHFGSHFFIREKKSK